MSVIISYTGEFGIVYKAKFSRGGFGTTMSEVVAVKTLKGSAVNVQK